MRQLAGKRVRAKEEIVWEGASGLTVVVNPGGLGTVTSQKGARVSVKWSSGFQMSHPMPGIGQTVEFLCNADQVDEA